jgi:hypothetical protein
MVAMVMVVMVMAVPVAAAMDRAMVMMMAAVLARRDDRGHGAERRDRGCGRSGIVVAVVVTAASIGGQSRSSHSDRGRGSNSDCAACHDTHCGVLAHVVSSLETNIDLIKIDRRDSGAANYVFAI